MKLVYAGMLLLVMVVSVAHAIDTAPAFEDPVLQARYDRLIQELRCVQCRNQSIADSNVFLAADLRGKVRELIAKGHSDAEVLTFMSDRYGEYVLLKPPFTPHNWVLWMAPVLLLGIGGVVAGRFILAKARLPQESMTDDIRNDGQGDP
jgi:cytochrome c-type biogenesis protein CcmH